ncbi:MAG TPA: hypothetical protein VK166_15820 [Chitinophagaceae bacterium]|nr:hypothetical protein [Chitinophagaceae bacterium]
MNATHIHLLLNHFPIIGTLIGSALLIWGFIKKQDNIKIAACIVIVVMALMAIPVFLTGEPAEDAVENLPGIAENIIEEHEEAAQFAIWILGFTGLMALVSLIGYKMQHKLVKTAFTLTLILSVLGFAAMARTGYTGGQVRHTELRSGAIVQGEGAGQEPGGDSNKSAGKEEDDD